MSEPAASAPAPAVPRPAATILVLRDDPFEVLMVRRHGNGQFASALVFPGGLVDPADHDPAWLPLLDGADGLEEGERALRIAAFRETFEESALLLARRADGTPVACPAAGDLSFRETVAASGGLLPLGDLAHFGHWITPDMAPKRFDTHFFLAEAPAGQEAICDGGETVALEWVAPRDILARAADGDLSILFPTRMNLKRLAESGSVAEAIAAARVRPRFTVHPKPEKREGGIAVVIPIEAGYGETENFHPHPPRAA
ncbi:NUDIX hydrolase [Sphingomonas immobilis]|uniref:NUDIX hydrolase n=1 Tax=Sphingomonas immobilis TaxID=3063997 RepID=A0ABT8ZZN0_9SPHN|nr:NUDIX hydrolase [Sphingomonas sp. CA1-15]MDO7842211.1 NUDIX hydrolase [Sphingomonas sp. CA1-15]